jgi:hypothetical protein
MSTQGTYAADEIARDLGYILPLSHLHHLFAYGLGQSLQVNLTVSGTEGKIVFRGGPLDQKCLDDLGQRDAGLARNFFRCFFLGWKGQDLVRNPCGCQLL